MSNFFYNNEPTPKYILDKVKDAVATYSLRKMVSGATKAIRVRDDTNTEIDIGFYGDKLDALGRNVAITNLLGNDGNFAIDSNADGLGDGWITAGATKSMASNEQTFTATGQYLGISYTKTNGATIGDKIYVCAYINAPYSGNVYLGLIGTISVDSYVTTTGSFVFTSALSTSTSTNVGMKILDSKASAWSAVKVKQSYTLNLTKIFGAGNEPTQAKMDSYMKNITSYFSVNYGSVLTGGTLGGWLSRNRVSSVPLGVDGGSGTSSGWTGYSDAGLTIAKSCNGEYQQLEITNSTSPGTYFIYYEFAVINGNSYSFSVDSMLVSKTNSGRLSYQIQILDSGKSVLSSSGGTSGIIPNIDSDFATRTLSGTVNNINAKYIRVFIAVASIAVGDAVVGRYKNVSVAITNQSAYISKWYDQSGNVNDATQTTASNQPRIVNSGILHTDTNGNPRMFFDGTDDGLNITASGSLDLKDALTISTVAETANIGVTGYIICRNGSTFAEVQYATTYHATDGFNLTLEGVTRATTYGGSISSNINYITTAAWDKANAYAYVNGNVGGNASAFSGTLTTRANIQIGSRSNSTDGSAKLALFNGYISEIIIFNKYLPQTKRKMLEYNQSKFCKIAIS